jgi:excisionase family DNA binding protein
MPVLAMHIEEAAQKTGAGRTVLYQEIRAGRLIARKIGRRTVITTADLETWLATLPARDVRRPRAPNKNAARAASSVEGK